MSSTARPTFRARLGLVAAALVALVAAPLALAGPAQAHDVFLGGDPKRGSSVDVAPDRITLTFSAELKDIAGNSNQIKVTNRDGVEVTDGDTVVKGDTLSRKLGKLPAGTYDVLWSALSSDGHRIHNEDAYAFTVLKGEKPKASSSAESTAKATPSASASAKPTAGATDQPLASEAVKNASNQTTTLMWLIGGALVLALLLGIVLQLTRRKPRE